MIQVVFDFDGTLFDSSEGIFNSFVYASRCTGINPPELHSFIKHIGPPVHLMLDKINPNISPHLKSNFVQHFRKHYDSYGYLNSSCYDGILDILAYISSNAHFLPPCIVTNKPTRITEKLLHKHLILDCFEHVIGIDYAPAISCGESLPTKCHSISCLKSILSLPEMMIYVGDTPSDLSASVESGCSFIAVDYGFHSWSPSELKSFPLATTVSDLYNILTNLTYSC